MNLSKDGVLVGFNHTNGDVTRSNYAKCRTKQYGAVFWDLI